MRNDSPEIYILGSSSSGNAYIFTFKSDDGMDTSILVESGFPWKELTKRAILQGTSITKCEACLITHSHGDHATGAKVVNERGIKVYASLGTLTDRMCSIQANQYNTLKDMQPIYITPRIMVLPFLVEHDAPEPMGFVIRDNWEKQNILFVNDCKTFKADLSRIPLHLVFIECNYSDKPLHYSYNTALKEGDVVMVKQYDRIMKSHMGLYGCRKILNSLDLSQCHGIFLMHLSDRNARQQEMRETIGAEHPNIPIFICRKEGGLV